MAADFRLPDRDQAQFYLRVIITQVLLFAVIYGGSNWLTAHREQVGHYYFAWELTIPLFPRMIWVYHSILLLFLVPMFLLTREQVSAIGRAFACVTLLGGLCFLLFPGVAGFTRVDYANESGLQALAFSILYHADNVHNVMPSLHVAYCTLVILAIQKQLEARKIRLLFWGWLLAIVTSTVLVHQHHLIDLPTGAILGYAGYRFFLRWSAAPTAQIATV
ncbi:MAG: phosphatase PAP2 family protein [Moraxellaceae bacterium]